MEKNDPNSPDFKKDKFKSPYFYNNFKHVANIKKGLICNIHSKKPHPNNLIKKLKNCTIYHGKFDTNYNIFRNVEIFK